MHLINSSVHIDPFKHIRVVVDKTQNKKVNWQRTFFFHQPFSSSSLEEIRLILGIMLCDGLKNTINAPNGEKGFSGIC